MNAKFIEAQQLFTQNNFSEALKILDEHLMLDSDDIKALNLRGRIYCKMQKWGNAMNDYSSVLEIDSENSEAKTGLEMVKSILGYFTPDLFNP